MFQQLFSVEIASELLDDGTTEGVCRGYYTNEQIAPDEKLLVVEVQNDEEEINEIAKVKTPNGWENAIITEDYEPWFAEGEPLHKIQACRNLADAVLANKLHPCKNGDIFGMGQMFTNENLNNYKASANNLGLFDGPQLQTFLVANPLFEIAVGVNASNDLASLYERYDELQATFDAGKNIWDEQVKGYRSGDSIAVYTEEAGTYDVFQGMYIGRTENHLGKPEHIGICSKGVYIYHDDWNNPVNVAKELYPIEPHPEQEGEFQLVEELALRASLGWVPDSALLLRAQSLETLETNLSTLADTQVSMFQDIEMEG